MVPLVCEEVVNVAIYSSLFELSLLSILLLLQQINTLGCELIFVALWEVLKVILKNV